ncbi:general substrate transporter [Phaffia rhodozyma]|uniref:General substrate transporter n=1 Tax=Phaffia rhodozyma TaxID=264483 RepID=A0A0F7SHS1_PHARH|nr:general substrate transporter [Phaffia rhodozyma]
MVMSPKLYTFLCGCFAALGSILFGYDLGIIGSVLPSTNFLETMNHPNDTVIGFITSMMLLGAFVGCIPSSLVADKFGRKKAIFVGSIIFIIGGSLQTAAQGLGEMLAGRGLAGVGIGMLSFLAPLYQAEIAHPSIRGRLTTLQQFFLGIGAFIASFMGYGFYTNYPGREIQWRVPLGIQILPALPLAALIFLFPESPRWLVAVGREDDALVALARLHANGNTEDIFVQTELRDLQLAIEEERRVAIGAYTQMFTVPSNLRRVLIGVFLQMSMQATGVSVLQYYAPRIFLNIGFGASKTLMLQSINSVLALIGQAACIMCIDKVGRRWPLIIGNIVSSSTFCVGTAIMASFPPDSTHNVSASWAFVMMTWIFNFAFSSCLGPLSWAVPVEIFNTKLRAKATAITSMGAWIANFAIAQATPYAFSAIGWKYYLVFGICGFTNALFVWLFVPETKGRKLEEMDHYFESTHWIVPLAKYEPISATTREDELRRGIATGKHVEPGHLERNLSSDPALNKEKYDGEQDMIEDMSRPYASKI